MAVESAYVSDRLRELCVDARSTICGDRTNPLFRILEANGVRSSAITEIVRGLSLNNVGVRRKVVFLKRRLADEKVGLVKEVFDLYDLSRVIE